MTDQLIISFTPPEDSMSRTVRTQRIDIDGEAIYEIDDGYGTVTLSVAEALAFVAHVTTAEALEREGR